MLDSRACPTLTGILGRKHSPSLGCYVRVVTRGPHSSGTACSFASGAGKRQTADGRLVVTAVLRDDSRSGSRIPSSRGVGVNAQLREGVEEQGDAPSALRDGDVMEGTNMQGRAVVSESDPDDDLDAPLATAHIEESLVTSDRGEGAFDLVPRPPLEYDPAALEDDPAFVEARAAAQALVQQFAYRMDVDPTQQLLDLRATAVQGAVTKGLDTLASKIGLAEADEDVTVAMRLWHVLNFNGVNLAIKKPKVGLLDLTEVYEVPADPVKGEWVRVPLTTGPAPKAPAGVGAAYREIRWESRTTKYKEKGSLLHGEPLHFSDIRKKLLRTYYLGYRAPPDRGSSDTAAREPGLDFTEVFELDGVAKTIRRGVVEGLDDPANDTLVIRPGGSLMLHKNRELLPPDVVVRNAESRALIEKKLADFESAMADEKAEVDAKQKSLLESSGAAEDLPPELQEMDVEYNEPDVPSVDLL